MGVTSSAKHVVWLMLAVLLFSLASPLHAEQNSPGWYILKGQHFVLHLEGNDPLLAQKILREAESYYDKISTSLGYSRREAWLEENRCEMHLFKDRLSYVTNTGKPGWSNAAASPLPRKRIEAHLEAPSLLAVELPHEIAHLLFRSYVGVENANVPLWLDEGVALTAEQGARAPALEKILTANIQAGRLISVRDLTGISEGASLRAWGSPGASVSLFYAEAYGLVQFLTERHGHGRFTEFVRRLKNGDSLETALARNYGHAFRSLDSLEEEWQKSLQFARSS